MTYWRALLHLAKSSPGWWPSTTGPIEPAWLTPVTRFGPVVDCVPRSDGSSRVDLGEFSQRWARINSSCRWNHLGGLEFAMPVREDQPDLGEALTPAS